MGSSYSDMEKEKMSWIDHTLQFNNNIRECNLEILENIKGDTEFFLGKVTRTWGGVTFEHWFLADDKAYHIEFGSKSDDLYQAMLQINTCTDSYEKTSKLPKKMVDLKDRILHVLGMSNYSLCLRNSEHVANYIFHERWISSQMDEDGKLMWYFKSALNEKKKCVNTFPSSVRPHVFDSNINQEIYSFTTNHFKANSFEYYLDADEKSYNVLIIGPTCSGKSHLVNVIFNRPICTSNYSLFSVTKEVYFIKGKGNIYDHSKKCWENKDVVVIDTIGLCDTDWDDKKVFEYIKGRVSKNFKNIDVVFVTFRADKRLQQTEIDNMMACLNWLNYKRNAKKIAFLACHADFLDENAKNNVREEAKISFDALNSGNSLDLIFTGFPKEDQYMNQMQKGQVLESWERLSKMFSNGNEKERIYVQPGSRCVIL